MYVHIELSSPHKSHLDLLMVLNLPIWVFLFRDGSIVI